MTIEHLQPPGDDLPTCFVLRCPVQRHDPEKVALAHADEVSTFAVQKRCDEHLTGRWLLQEALTQWGIDTTLVSVERTEHRAPYLAYIAGVWITHRSLRSASVTAEGGLMLQLLSPDGALVWMQSQAREGFSKTPFL
jgi:4'-phosphopantetheinyl transferase EntD